MNEWALIRYPSTGAWGSLFKTEAYHSQRAKEAAEVGGRRTFSVIPMHLIDKTISPEGPPAALREVQRRVRASKLSVFEKRPHAPVGARAWRRPGLRRGMLDFRGDLLILC
jgi:hypothetical protein